MTEADIQRALTQLSTPRDIAAVPNCTVYGHESDWLRVSENRVVHEYEVKVSRSDFKRDAKKYRWYREARIILTGATSPNYFCYAVPAGLVTLDELPKGAGLVEVSEDGIATVTKRPSRRHGDACPDRILNWILRGQRSRYEAAIAAGDAEAARAHKSLQAKYDGLARVHSDDLGRLAAVERRYETLVEAIAAGVDVHAIWRETEDDSVAKWLGRDTVFRDRVYAAVREQRAA